MWLKLNLNEVDSKCEPAMIHLTVMQFSWYIHLHWLNWENGFSSLAVMWILRADELLNPISHSATDLITRNQQRTRNSFRFSTKFLNSDVEPNVTYIDLMNCVLI